MPRPPAPPLSRDRAWSCITMNASIPGTGTLRARRRLTGTFQLMFLFSGFFMICDWMFKFFFNVVREQLGEPVSPHHSAWMWKWGAVCMGISWVWTFFTCVSLYRQAKAHERLLTENPPPRISEMPPRSEDGRD